MLISRILLHGNDIDPTKVLFQKATRWFYWVPFKNKRKIISDQLEASIVHLETLWGKGPKEPRFLEYYNAQKDILLYLRILGLKDYKAFANGEKISFGDDKVALQWIDWNVSVEELLTHKIAYMRRLGRMILTKYPNEV